MIDTVVFDISGVLADYRIMEFLAEKGFDSTMIRRILKASAMSPYWEQFERGELSEEEALQGFTSMDPEIGEELRTAFSSVAGLLTNREEAIPVLQKLKNAGLRLYYLSNYSKKAYEECGESLAFMPYMDGGLVSFQIGKTKPDPAMFQALLTEYGLNRETCAFVDDTPENVKAAEALGFQGIVFTSFEQLLNDLETLGVTLNNTDPVQA